MVCSILYTLQYELEIWLISYRALLRDPKDYPNPEVFSPERFLNKDGTLNPDVLDPTTIAFGFGRR